MPLFSNIFYEDNKWRCLHIDQFMEKDHDNQSHWVPLDTRMAIQGLLAERDDEMRVYVVTINTPLEYAWILIAGQDWSD